MSVAHVITPIYCTYEDMQKYFQACAISTIQLQELQADVDNCAVPNYRMASKSVLLA